MRARKKKQPRSTRRHNGSPEDEKPEMAMTNANIRIPWSLHDLMRELAAIRHKIEGADVTISRLYIEAVRFYLDAEQQQELLKRKALRMAG